mmetsp:Transcript_30596/g.65526  ORF Transcript_30596/g.65526 Transcript_30596/m.65526 type:complete len:256 (-) Transcript_30596:261-1028(-)
MAIRRAHLVAVSDMLAMQTRPERSWSATFRKRSLGFLIVERTVPLASTWVKASRRAVRGTRRRWKERMPLSTPLQPILWPMSSMPTSGSGWPGWPTAPSRMRQRKAWTPWSWPRTSMRAKMTAHCEWQAPFVIQYFFATVVGVLITHSSVLSSSTAVVCICTALLPNPNSVSAKQPTESMSSIDLRKDSSLPPKCFSVPSLSTVPPKRLNWTVIFVARLPSHSPVSSCAAKILIGSFLKSFTERAPTPFWMALSL